MINKYYLNDIKKLDDLHFNIETAILNADFAEHEHDFSELVIITEGSGQHIIDGEEYPIHPGDVYVINGDVTHGFRQVSHLGLYNIMFNAEELLSFTHELKQLAGFQALFILEPFYRKEHRFKSRLQLGPKKLEQVKALLVTLLEEYSTKKDGFRSMIQAYFMALVTFLSREYTVGRENSASWQLLRIAEAVAHMENHYTEPVRLEELAARAFLSPRHFTRIFMENYHTTPIEYVIGLRLHHAGRLLRQTGLNVTRIAQESGFTDSNYFTRQFRKRFGLSPSEYRKQK